MITQEQYNNLMTNVEALNAKVDLYIRCQNSTEREFRELERKVYRLEQGEPTFELSRMITAPRQRDTTEGVAWLR